MKLKFNYLSFAGLLLLSVACAKSDDQKRFEEEAFSNPDGITEMTVGAEVVQSDPDDWRISPMYQGFIEVATPAFPNPVPINSPLRIDLDIKGIESIPGIEVWVFQTENDLVGPVYTNSEASLPPGLETIDLSPVEFSNTQQQAVGLHRILIFDGRQNVISYGDVEVQ